MKENSLRIIFMGLVTMCGQMGRITLGIGRGIRWTGRGRYPGAMGGLTRESIRMIKRVAMEFINGLMVEYMRATGSRADRKGKASTLIRRG